MVFTKKDGPFMFFYRTENRASRSREIHMDYGLRKRQQKLHVRLQLLCSWADKRITCWSREKRCNGITMSISPFSPFVPYLLVLFVSFCIVYLAVLFETCVQVALYIFWCSWLVMVLCWLLVPYKPCKLCDNVSIIWLCVSIIWSRF